MNFQNPRDAQHVSMIAGKTTKWMPINSYTYRHGRRDRQSGMTPLQVDLLSVSDLMMLKPEESILHVAGAPVFKVLKIEGSDAPRFGACKKFKTPPRPVIRIVETGGINEKLRFNDEGSVIYVSTLDGLRKRLDLNPLRVAGVDLTAALVGDRQGRGRKDDVSSHEPAKPVVDRELLADQSWGGVAEREPDRQRYFERTEQVVDVSANVVRSPVLSKQELKEGFGTADLAKFSLPEGEFDGSIHPGNADAQAVNDGIVSLFGEVKRSVPTEALPAVQHLEDVILDPLQEE